MTKLLIISDTHVPARARDLPPEVWRAVERSDLVIHAGDWMDERLLDQLERRSAGLLAVWGNNDGEALRARLPETATRTIDGIRFAVTHETGASTGREKRCDERFPDTDVLVFGHSHIPWDSVTPRGLRLLNPGSPTDRRRQPFCSYLTVSASSGKLSDVELHQIAR